MMTGPETAPADKHIVVTGADGFIGRNLCRKFEESGIPRLTKVTRETSDKDLKGALTEADIVIHLAGVNRSDTPTALRAGNVDVTRKLCEMMVESGRRVPIAYSSSIQAEADNPYGRGKLESENLIRQYSRDCGAPFWLFRLANVFGKWCRPNYNSVVATFCHLVARSLPIRIDDPSSTLKLVHVDDVVNCFLAVTYGQRPESGFVDAGPIYPFSVGALAQTIEGFAQSRGSLETGRVGTGLLRALYATYVSYLPASEFSYPVPVYQDARGEFAEMLKTPDCGQFSYFTAAPGVTRGEHYHHSKSEKFLVIRGTARFGFRNVETGESVHIDVTGGNGRIVESAPGWVHDITNVGTDELIVMLWANEVFDRDRPDTISGKVKP